MMKTVTLICVSLLSSYSFAQSYDLSEAPPVEAAPQVQELIDQAARPTVNGVDVKTILDEVRRQERQESSRGARAQTAVRNVGVWVDSVDEFDEHSVDEFVFAIRVAGYRQGDFMTFHISQELDEAQQTMAKNRLRKALKVAFQAPINQLRGRLRTKRAHDDGFVGEYRDEVSENDAKGYSVADRALDTIRLDPDKVRFKLYSRSEVDSNRDISLVKRVGEKVYMEMRYNRSLEHRLHYGMGANVGARNDRGEKNSSFVFYIGAKLDAFNRLVK